MAFHRFRTPILLVESLFSEFDSSNCQFDSAFWEVDSSLREFVSSSCQFDSSFYEFDSSLTTSVRRPLSFCRFVVSLWRFIVSLCRFVVSTRPLREAIIRRTLHDVFSIFPRFWSSPCEIRNMEELRGILENAISKIEDISSPPNERDNNQVNQQSTSSISRAEANWR